MRYVSGPASFEFDARGQLTSAVHERDPHFSYLSGASVTGAVVTGLRLGDAAPDIVADADELEVAHTYAGLRLVVRHTFAGSWGLRVVFANLTDAPLQVEQSRLNLRPGPGAVAWALALGETAAYAVSPADGGGPLLGGLLRSGSLYRPSVDGVDLGAFELRPGGRHVVQLLWDFYQVPRDFDQERYGVAPTSLFVRVGEPIHVQVNEDVAVVAPSTLEATQEGSRLELVSTVPGRFPVELRAATGTTAFALHWVPAAEELLAAAAQRALSAPHTSAGVVKLADVAAALVVQSQLIRGGLDEPDEAADALDLFTAHLLTTADPRPLPAAYLSREFDRVGDADLLAAASRSVLAHGAPAPGLGIAATQLCLALLVSERPVHQVLAHLAVLALRAAEPFGAAVGPVADEAAALEIRAVTDAGPGAAGSLPAGADQRRRIAALGLQLGAGLKGQAVAPLPVDQLSHLITVFQLLPEGLSSSMASRWGCTAHALAGRATPELLSRLPPAPTEAHAWLVLALDAR